MVSGNGNSVSIFVGNRGLKFIELFDGESGVTDQFPEQAETKFIMPSHLPSPRRGEGWGEGERGHDTRDTDTVFKSYGYRLNLFNRKILNGYVYKIFKR